MYNFPAKIYLFKVNDRNTRKRCDFEQIYVCWEEWF